MALVDIYVLELQGGNYYVGKTNDIQRRYQEHLDGKGSAWTKRFPPIKIVKTISNASVFDEDKVTLEYMEKYGIDEVRGGQYSNVTFTPEQISSIAKTIWAAHDRCLRCGRRGHFVTKCSSKTTVTGRSLVSDGVVCGRCGRGTHMADNCKNKTHVDGSRLDGIYCTRCGRDTHLAEICKNKTHVDGSRLDGILCTRCGRNTHLAETCKNKTHVDGSRLDGIICTRCGRDTHLAETCKNKTRLDGSYIEKMYCTRCERDSHFAETCVNKTRLDGSYIEKMYCNRCGRDSHLEETCTNKTKIIEEPEKTFLDIGSGKAAEPKPESDNCVIS